MNLREFDLTNINESRWREGPHAGIRRSFDFATAANGSFDGPQRSIKGCRGGRLRAGCVDLAVGFALGGEQADGSAAWR